MCVLKKPTAGRRQSIALAFVASLSDRVISLLSNLLLLPLVISVLPSDRTGLWLVLAAAPTLLGVVDFGLMPSILRHIALIRGKSLDASSPSNSAAKTASKDIANAIHTARWLYGLISVAMAMTAALLCGWWVAGLGVVGLSSEETRTIAMVFAVQIGGLTMSQFGNSVLLGLGEVASVSTMQATVRGIGLAFKLGLILWRPSLIGLIIVEAGCCWTLALWSHQSARRNAILGGYYRGGRWCRQTLTRVAPIAARTWLTCLAAFLTSRTDQFFVAAAIGIHVVPLYQSAWLLIQNIGAVALMIPRISMPKLSLLWGAGNHKQVRQSTFESLDLAMVPTIGGSIALVMAGPSLFELWLGPNHFVGTAVLTVMVVTLIAETHCTVFGLSVRSMGQEPFARVTWIAAGLNLGLTSVLVGPFGLLGVAAATLVAQSLTNNWYIVRTAYQLLGIGWERHWADHLRWYLQLGVLIGGPLALLSHFQTTGRIATLDATFWCFICFAWSSVVCLTHLGVRYGRQVVMQCENNLRWGDGSISTTGLPQSDG